MPRKTITQPDDAGAESPITDDPWLETVADESSPYQPTKKDLRVVLREVKRLSGHPAAAFLASGDAEHLVPHRLIWQNGDRPELRCPGRDGGLECHLILNHNGRCHG